MSICNLCGAYTPDRKDPLCRTCRREYMTAYRQTTRWKQYKRSYDSTYRAHKRLEQLKRITDEA